MEFWEPLKLALQSRVSGFRVRNFLRFWGFSVFSCPCFCFQDSGGDLLGVKVCSGSGVESNLLFRYPSGSNG